MSFNAINARTTLLVSHTCARQGKANDSIYNIRDRIWYIESAK